MTAILSRLQMANSPEGILHDSFTVTFHNPYAGQIACH